MMPKTAAAKTNPKPWVVVIKAGQADEESVFDCATAAKAYAFMAKHNQPTDLMKRLNAGTLTTEF